MYQSTPLSPREKIIVIGAIATLLSGLAWVSYDLGSLSIPHNDSWAHSRIAESLAENHVIQLVGFNRSSLIGMIILAAIFGGTPLAGSFVSLICAFASLYWVYMMTRRYASRFWSTIAVSLLACYPGFFLLSTSFMSDIPMLAGILGCLYFALKYLDNPTYLYLLASLFIGFWGITVREQAVAAVAAVVVVLVTTPVTRKQGIWYALISLAFIVSFEFWRRSLALDDPPQVDIGVGYGIKSGLMFIILLACFMSPLIAANLIHKKYSFKVYALMAVLSMPFIFLLLRMQEGVLLGNYIATHGAYAGDILGNRPGVPALSLLFFATCGALCAGPLLILMFENLGKKFRLLILFSCFYIAGTIVQSVSGQGIFDRYMIPVVACLVPVLASNLGSGLKFSKLISVIFIAGTFSISSLIFLEASASDGSVWKTAEKFVAQGYNPKEIDAGWNWVGLHSDQAVGSRVPPENALGSFQHFSDSRQCLVLGFEGANLPEHVATYKTFGYFGPERNIFAKNIEPCV